MAQRSLILVSTILTGFFTLLPGAAHAEALKITAVSVASSGPVEKALLENRGRATTSIEGNGAILRLTYKASQPLTIYMVPLSAENTFVPTDFLLLTLPTTEAGTAEIDLTISPGWAPRNTVWLLHLLTKDENADTGFATVEFVPTPVTTILTTFFRHLFRVEPYSPSSYHALRGYRIFSVSVTILLGIALVLCCIAALLLSKKSQKLQMLTLVLVSCQLLYGLRFGIDLLRFTHEHHGSFVTGTYDEAGSVYLVALTIRDLAEKSAMQEEKMTVLVCRSGTNYKEKLLRYFAYPIRISSDSKHEVTAQYVLVMNALDWSIEEVTMNGSNKQILHCEDQTFEVKKLSDFPDGSVLFSLIR